jgi:hypothetical protein
MVTSETIYLVMLFHFELKRYLHLSKQLENSVSHTNTHTTVLVYDATAPSGSGPSLQLRLHDHRQSDTPQLISSQGVVLLNILLGLSLSWKYLGIR